jgi:hypothetical protein
MKNLIVLLVIAGGFNACTPQGAREGDSLKWKHLKNEKLKLGKSEQKTVLEKIQVLESFAAKTEFKIVERQADKAAAQNIFDGLRLTTQNLFVPQVSPYAGMISAKVKCEEKGEPMVEVSGDGEDLKKGFLLFANVRKQVETCPGSTSTFGLLHMIIHCQKANTTYEVKVYSREKSQDLLREYFAGFQCV